MSKPTIFSTISLILIIFSFNSISLFGQKTLIEIDDIYPEDVRMEGFILNSNQKVNIDAVGFYFRDEENRMVFGNSWILDADSREVVWDLSEAGLKRRNRGLLEFSDDVSLPKGVYEVYYASHPITSFSIFNIHVLEEFIGSVFKGWFRGDRDNFNEEIRDLFRDFRIVIKGDGKSLSNEDVYRRQEKQKDDAFIWISGNKKNLYKSVGFIVSQTVEVDVYSIGELTRDRNLDYGWIQDANSRERVWELSYRKSKEAGGARKNRMRRSALTLPKGKYSVVYSTDGSHSPRRWNSQPPFDPEFWGIRINLKNPKDRKKVEFFDSDKFISERTVVNLTKVRDSEVVSYGFKLKKDMDLNIYSVGEGDSGEMVDHGWIINASDRKRVWEMKYRDTKHAGGADKNRVFDEVVRFRKGEYIAYYVTDGSHSYRMWNSSPPSDQQAWGLRLISVDDKFNAKDVEEYKEKEDKNVLASVINVGNNEMVSARFSLKERTRVRIYTIGEGSGGQMHDYGWIEDLHSGRTIWEMSYRITEHAGGAKKNRMFDGTIILESGEYEVVYETDGSHCFNDWNASQPYDPFNWGITVRVVE